VNVYLVRHAQSEENALDLRSRMSRTDFGALLGRSAESALTPLGQQQAQAVADRLAQQPIERLYCSPFLRARATAEVIGATIGLTPVLVDDLREVLPRPVDGAAQASLRRLFISGYLGLFLPGTGESWRAGYQRAKRAFATITAEPAQQIVAVAHATLISLILLGCNRDPRWRVLVRDLSNAGVSVVVRNEE
jgi:broad specificity phosphatase PhoE